MRTISLTFALSVLAPFIDAQEHKVVEVSRIRLYLPDEALRQRIGDAALLVAYIKSLQKETATFWEKAEKPNTKGLLIAIGVKPDKKSKVWCQAVEGEIAAETLTKFEKQLSAVAPVTVKEGPIAFALEVKFLGQQPARFPEMPKVWADAAKNAKAPLLVPDGLFKIVWAD